MGIKVLLKLMRNICIDCLNRKESQKMIVALCIRCLMKLCKLLPKITDYLDVSSILYEMHKFYVDIGDKNNGENDPCNNASKMIKTLLHEIVKIIGFNIWNFFDK